MVIDDKGLERKFQPFVGMIRLERTTPTSRTWCASQLRYIPIKNKLAYASLLMYTAIPLFRFEALFL